MVWPIALAQQAETMLNHRNRLERIGAILRLATDEIPKGPGRSVHHGVHKQGTDVEVVGKSLVHCAHRISVSVVPCAQISCRFAILIAVRQRLDQRRLDRRTQVGVPHRLSYRVESEGEGLGQIVLVEFVPLFVVVRSAGVTDSPVGHGAAWVRLCGSLEAGDRLEMIEGVSPDKATIEPLQGQWRSRGDGARVRPKVEIIVRQRGIGGFGCHRKRPRN